MVAGAAATQQAQDLADAAISYLAPGESPWTALADALSTLNPSFTKGAFVTQCWCQLALIACSTCVLLSGLSIKLFQGQLWLYRWRKGYVVPHYSTTYCFGMMGMQGLMLGYIYRNIQRAQGHNASDLSLWLSLTWLPGVLGIAHAGWSLAVSHAIHVLTTQGRLTSPLLRSGFLNGVGITGVLGLSSSVGSLTYFAQQKYHETLNSAAALDLFIGEGVATYNGTFTTSTLSQVVLLTADVIEATDDYIYCFKSVFMTYAIWLGLAMIFLIIVAAVHLRTLHASSVDKAFESLYKSLVVITLSFVIVGASFLVALILETAMARQVITQSAYAEAGALFPPYIYSLGGLPLSCFLLSKSFQPTPRMRQRRLSRAGSDVGKSSFGHVSFVAATHQQQSPPANSVYPMTYPPSAGAKQGEGDEAMVWQRSNGWFRSQK